MCYKHKMRINAVPRINDNLKDGGCTFYLNALLSDIVS